MAVICPQCSHVRTTEETAPDWQCPSCAICYAKFPGNASGRANAPKAEAAVEFSPRTGAAMGKLLMIAVIAVIAWSAWTGIKKAPAQQTPAAVIENASALTDVEMAAVAVTVKPGDVTMYTTTECVYCAQAKGWLRENKFEFKECNMSVDEQCTREFKQYGAAGTPFLIVRGHQMKDGFDSDEFITALKRTPSGSSI